MRRPDLFFNRACKVILVMLALYSFCWYMVGQYLKSNAANIANTYLNIEQVSHEGIDLEGFPFHFALSVNRLGFVINNEGERTTIFTKKVWIKSDLLIKNFKLDLRRKLYVSSEDNKYSYVIKAQQDSNVDFGLTKSMLRRVLFNPDLKIFMSYLCYFDSGYDIMDKNTEKIIAISRYNKITIKKDYNKKKRESVYDIKADLHSAVGGEERFKELGNNHFKLRMSYKATKMLNNNLKSFILDIKKMDLISDDYHIKTTGKLSSNLVTRNASGQIDTRIKSLRNFLKTCEVFVKKKKVINLEKIITKMSSEPKKDGNVKDVFFSISGNEKGVKYGNIGGFHRLLSLMQ